MGGGNSDTAIVRSIDSGGHKRDGPGATTGGRTRLPGGIEMAVSSDYVVFVK